MPIGPMSHRAGLSGKRSQEMLNRRQQTDGENSPARKEDAVVAIGKDVTKEPASATPPADVPPDEIEIDQDQKNEQKKNERPKFSKIRPNLSVDTDTVNDGYSAAATGGDDDGEEDADPPFTFGMDAKSDQNGPPCSAADVIGSPIGAPTPRQMNGRGRGRGRRFSSAAGGKGKSKSKATSTGRRGEEAEEKDKEEKAEELAPRNIGKLVQQFEKTAQDGVDFIEMLEEESKLTDNLPLPSIFSHVLKTLRQGEHKDPSSHGPDVFHLLHALLQKTYDIASPSSTASGNALNGYFSDDSDHLQDPAYLPYWAKKKMSPPPRLRPEAVGAFGMIIRLHSAIKRTMSSIRDIVSPYEFRETIETITRDLPSPAQRGFSEFAAEGLRMSGPALGRGGTDNCRDEGSVSTFQGTVLTINANPNDTFAGGATGDDDDDYFADLDQKYYPLKFEHMERLTNEKRLYISRKLLGIADIEECKSKLQFRATCIKDGELTNALLKLNKAGYGETADYALLLARVGLYWGDHPFPISAAFFGRNDTREARLSREAFWRALFLKEMPCKFPWYLYNRFIERMPSKYESDDESDWDELEE